MFTSTFTNRCREPFYGFRYYLPETGRWASRDPIEEDGGIDVYEFVCNNGIDYYDYVGLYTPFYLSEEYAKKVCSCVEIQYWVKDDGTAGRGLLGKKGPTTTISKDSEKLNYPNKRATVFFEAEWRDGEECDECREDKPIVVDVDIKYDKGEHSGGTLVVGKEKGLGGGGLKASVVTHTWPGERVYAGATEVTISVTLNHPITKRGGGFADGREECLRITLSL